MTHHCLHRLRRVIRRWLDCPEWRACVLGPGFCFQSIYTNQRTTVSITLRDTDPGVRIALSTKKDGAGFSPPAGTIEWTCSDPSILTIAPANHGLLCDVQLAQPVKLGSATVTAKDMADPDLPPLTFNVDVVAGRLSGYDATITPLPPSADPAEPKATDEHQVVS